MSEWRAEAEQIRAALYSSAPPARTRVVLPLGELLTLPSGEALAALELEAEQLRQGYSTNESSWESWQRKLNAIQESAREDKLIRSVA